MTPTTKAALDAVIEAQKIKNSPCMIGSLIFPHLKTIRAALEHAPSKITLTFLTDYIRNVDGYLTEHECQRVSKIISGFKNGIKIVQEKE